MKLQIKDATVSAANDHDAITNLDIVLDFFTVVKPDGHEVYSARLVRAIELLTAPVPNDWRLFVEACAEGEHCTINFGAIARRAKNLIANLALAAAPVAHACWSCKKPVTMDERSNADGDCPHCGVELDLDDWPVAAIPVQEQEPVLMTRQQVIDAMIGNNLLTDNGRMTLLNGDSITANLEFFTQVINFAILPTFRAPAPAIAPPVAAVAGASIPVNHELEKLVREYGNTPLFGARARNNVILDIQSLIAKAVAAALAGQAEHLDLATYWASEYKKRAEKAEAERDTATETWVDEEGTTWSPPTAFAYARVCEALKSKTAALAQAAA